MRLTIPGTRVGILSEPSKMPCKSFSLPAVRSCPSAVFGENTICGSCYARKGFYVWPVVQKALEARFYWAIQACLVPSLGDQFVDLLVLAIRNEAGRQYKRGETQAVFRVHDSGDLFSPQYAELWYRICFLCPNVKFWFPTRQWNTKNTFMILTLQKLDSLPNVAVRPSALHFEDSVPCVDGLSAGTTASVFNYNCPASEQDNKCLSCRQCWTKTIPISYHKIGSKKHGIEKTTTPTELRNKGTSHGTGSGFTSLPIIEQVA